ncbi:butyrophilin subfamily 1 member A1-like [Clupea harengus]|uniref:Butyrophilin subfamily 1 member A1-like n=1 Tax=Clupea harengus TaxID=7950 RepID=A0A6P8GAM4_CLUHA|nr:butyrophilin subfamily 1 member A1-like [Clupea harengus]
MDVVDILEFKVTVPSSLVVTLGQPVVLPCSFSVGNVWQPESIVITWRRGLEVVHSFYLNRDQLKHQNPHYVKRTSLYQSEMQKGNASLRLENVTIEDRGEYICYVRSQLGSERKIFPLKVAALYSEPVLQFSVQPGSVTVLLTSGGGFPAPTLSWLQDHEDLTNSTETRLTQDTLSGLYNVSSTLTLKDNSNATLSFILKNEDLMQEIRRNISLLFGSHPSVKLLKCADDTTLIGLISNGDEAAYRKEVNSLAFWCSQNHLELNALKTVEMVADFRRSAAPTVPARHV